MKPLEVCALFFIFAKGVLAGPPFDLEGRIVGGEDAPQGRYPFISSLRMRGSHFCGGPILNENWIVTAAHCVQYRDPSPITVVVGTNQLNQGGAEYQALQIIWNENYNGRLIQNDIGLIRAETISFNDRVQPIPINAQSVPGDVPVTIIGWGTTRLGGPLPNDLQFVNVNSVSVQKCQNSNMEFPILASQLCTFIKRGQGVCHGDSGGPVIYTNSKNEDRLVGLVSWANPCAIGYPDVHTRVHSFIFWINQKCNNCAKIQ